MSAPDDLAILRQANCTQAVEKFEELMTQSGRAFLIGAGCGRCAGLPLTVELTDKTLQSPMLNTSTKELLQDLQAEFAGASDVNIEDYLSELIDQLTIAERRTSHGATKKQIEINKHSFTGDELREATEQIKRAVADVIDQEVRIETHWHFIKAVHRPIRPGKSTQSQPIDYLVLNYDTLIEDALALEKIPFADGLDGGVTGWWNLSTFHQEGLAARVLKLHGSINWCQFPDDPLPRRVPKRLNVPKAENCHVLIWPASTKYRETQRDPYAQLADLGRQILRPHERFQRVLFVCGYSFGDSHINLEIDSALRESEGRLTVVVFSSNDQPSGQLLLWNQDHSVRDQVLVFAKRGFFHGDESTISSDDLPWWKFENITRLLGGER